MATKADVRAILKSGKLTGQEAARLMVQHFVDQDHRRGALLTKAQVKSITKAVASRPAEEILAYNAMLEAYRLVEYTLREAHIISLEIRRLLAETARELDRMVMAWNLLEEQLRWPAIVTEEQLADLQARQRERKLKQLYCLNQIIAERASEIIAQDETVKGDVRTQCEVALAQAMQQIETMIADGRLQPVELDCRADHHRLRPMQPALQAQPGSRNVSWWPESDQRWARGTTDDEKDRQLRTYVSGDQLYEASLPEWQYEIDTYRHWQESRYLPYNEQGPNVAVLHEPVLLPGMIDEHKYYRAPDLVELSGLPTMERSLVRREKGAMWLLQERHETIIEMLRFFLAHQPVLKALSDLIGVQLYERLDAWQKEIDEAIEGYASVAGLPCLQPVPDEERQHWAPEWLARKFPTPLLPLHGLKPDGQRVRQLQERMARPLGDAWWNEANWERNLVDDGDDGAIRESRANG